MRSRWLPWIVLGLVLVGCSRPETLSPVGEGGAGGDGGAGAGGGAGSDADGDGFPVPDDCDDSDPAIHPDAVEVPYDGNDQDCDGVDAIDLDGDGRPALAAGGDDCDDRSAEVNPGASELCGDGVDQDCSGADQPCPGTDRDLDGVTAESGDCNDGDPDIHPGASEIPYDGIDQDCDGSDLADVDGDGVPGTPAAGDDCDDDERTVHPGAPELCGDGVDQDCSGADVLCPEFDGDGDGYTPVQGDCDDTLASVHPGALEAAYDGIDQDCSGSDLTDVDHDCFRAVEPGGDDCDDRDAAVHPGAADACDDGIDQSCDGVDPVCATPQNDLDGDGHADAAVGGDDCDDVQPGLHPGVEEVPGNGVDEDCDGRDAVGTHFTLGQDADYADVAQAGSVFLAVWAEADLAAGTYPLWARTISADGAPVGARVRVDDPPVGVVFSWWVVVGGRASFLVAWKSSDADGAGSALWARRFRLDGTPAEPAVRLGGDECLDLADGTFGPGGYLLAWGHGPYDPRLGCTRTELVVSLAPEAGGWSEDVLDDPSLTSAEPGPLTLGSDPAGYLAVFQERAADGYIDLRGLPLDAAGRSAGPSFVLTNHPGSESAVALAFDGTHYVAIFNQSHWDWWDYYELRAQFVGRDGTPVYSSTAENLLVAGPVRMGGLPSLLLRGGALLAVWADERVPGAGLRAQGLGADGVRRAPGDGAGEPVLAGTVTTRSAAAATDGTCVLAATPERFPGYARISAAMLRPRR